MDIRNFPNGFEVKVYKKQDLIDCIEQNIIDKEIALEIIEKCELDAANYISKGFYTRLPFIGSVRYSERAKIANTPERRSIIKDAREILNKEQYVLFRKQLNTEDTKRIKYNRYYKYILSIAINKNRKLFNKLCKDKGELFARIWMYATNNVTAIDNEYSIIDDEQ